MNELKSQINRLPTKSGGLNSDLASLNSLVNMLNNPKLTGAAIPEEAKEEVKITLPHPVETPPADAAPVTLPPLPATKPPRQLNRIFFTGIIASGKDYVASACGAHVIGFADPLYALVNFMFGTTVSANQGKDIPGVRELLQLLGQWGRGDTSLSYPLTPARALMIAHVHAVGPQLPDDLLVDWTSFGMNKNIWLDSLVARANILPANRRVAVTNVRFENEHKLLSSQGWSTFHVMCSPATRQARMKRWVAAPSPSVLNDDSEKLAKFLDADVMSKGSKSGGKLRAIWNDTVPSPSPRLYNVNEWLQELAIGDAVVPDTHTMSQE